MSVVEVFPQDCGANATLLMEENDGLPKMAMWHGFYTLKGNDTIMNDLLVLIATFAGTYLCSLAFVIILTRLIFPFKTKEEMAASTIDRMVGNQKNVSRQTKIMLPLLRSQPKLTLNH